VNTFKKKILLAGLVTVFAFIVTIGTTYAWFTVGQSSQIGAVELQVQTDTSLLILVDDGYTMLANGAFLVDPESYSSSLTNSIISPIYNFTEMVLEPVTTANGTSYLQNDRSTPASSTEVIGQYIEFSVWLLSQANAVNVALKDLTVTADNGNVLNNAIREAVRLSLTPDGGAVQIYGLDKDYDFTFIPGQTGYDSTPDTTNNSILPATESALLLLHNQYYTSGVPVADESDTLALADTVVSLAADVPQKVTIRIWIEGWDVDCNNNVLDTVFGISFQMTVKPA
jgi:hypothetical protein